MKLKPKEYMARQESGAALYRWMFHVTKALSDSTIRNKFFREHVNAVEREFAEFSENINYAKTKSKTP